MTDLFTHADAIAAKHDGMSRVDEHADPEWKDLMASFVREVAQQNQTFTSDDVFDLAERKGMSASTHDLRAFGPVMMRAAKENICVKADRAPIPSRRRSLHASPRAVWRSLIYQQQ